ncbi:MAG: SusC/RagA family TonB-linked outer membrane protein [Candidatus Pseudobacter hemicellulosilyticus]|uniref:SusC/RagA family TonB-linked outer membrane protein n=1 Tax=Candidatus Pseudobacter hemicellulosilyticus TaxID=3121375 RepID=A0AAJ5WRU2_9BACT|nr:MAG: SusC/RagA family TonB-linked outer membrane protein [Pseudobacter sp.]
MRLTVILLTAVLSTAAGNGLSQSVSLKVNDATVEQVIAAVKKQTGYVFFYQKKTLQQARPVSISASNLPVKDFLQQAFKDQPFTFAIEGRSVVLALPESRERQFRANEKGEASSAIDLKGTVTDENGKPAAGVTVSVKGAGLMVVTNSQGEFSLPGIDADATLVLTSVNLETKEIRVNGRLVLAIRLQTKISLLGDVTVNINTGYQQLPRERATGSFTFIDSSLFNRAAGGNVIKRLEGIANGLVFNRQNLAGETVNNQPQMRVRGLSTMLGNTSPLIIVNNFPYDGDINALNPNDVENITILRDAAAASIWGARAGNGVIVITTKSGKYNQPARISVNSNVTIGTKPDLFFSRNYLPAPEVMQAQQEYFLNNSYLINNNTNIPLYVELLIKKRDGLISEQEFAEQDEKYRNKDIRDDWRQYFYQPAVLQQYSVGVNGGGPNYRYAFSAGYDKNREMFKGNENNRLTLSLQNTFKVTPKLELSGSVWVTSQKTNRNAILASGQSLTGKMPDIYESLVDEDGKASPLNMQLVRFSYQQNAPANLPALKLFDWLYRPLDELNLNDNTNEQNDYRLIGGLKYHFSKSLNLDITYQYIQTSTESQSYHQKESYYVRDLVNQFTQANGTRIIPYNGIMEFNPAQKIKINSGRALLSYNERFGADHAVNALAGAEIRQSASVLGFGQTMYNFDNDLWTGSAIYDFKTYYPTLPNSINQIPTRATMVPQKRTNRDLSYFGNASYSYLDRYMVSGSLRWDGSNLLGVRANQRGTALWSAGLGWEMSRESFYQLTDWVPYLRLRATYGSAGNIDRTQTSMPTMNFTTNIITGLQSGNLITAGNPSLRWEQVNTMNVGADWRAFNNRISGSIEYYRKAAKYLLGSNNVDPTTGVPSSFKLNYAAMRTWGWDLQISSRNLQLGSFEWNSSVLVNTSKNKVTKIKENPPANDYNYILNSYNYEQGKSVDRIYALPWYGLNPEDGSVLIYDKDGGVRKDYQLYYQQIRKNEFITAGTTVPLLTASLMNSFSWKGITISALITGKFNYVFRRTSMMPGGEFTTSYHMDYFSRWQQPGDEQHTNVPAKILPNKMDANATAQANIYRYSEVLIAKGDHIRLQDVNFSYALPQSLIKRWPVRSLRVYGYIRSMAILWRANDQGLDPEYINTLYPEPKSYSAGLQLEF